MVWYWQGDQIGQIFNIWLLLTWVFLKFYLNKQFQNTVCCTYFNIQMQFNATILTDNLSFCNLATVLATFPKIGQTSSHSGYGRIL